MGLQSSNRPWNWGQEIGFGGHWQERQELSNYRCGSSRGWTGKRNEKVEKYQDPAEEKFENSRVFLGLPRLLLLPGARENTSLNIISRTRINYLLLLLNMNMNMNSHSWINNLRGGYLCKPTITTWNSTKLDFYIFHDLNFFLFFFYIPYHFSFIHLLPKSSHKLLQSDKWVKLSHVC